MIDLHVHTTASDGALSPREVVRLAARIGLRAMAITDHDSVAGIAEAQKEGAEVGIEVIPGVELSARCRGGTLHVLGYYVLVDNPYFRKCLAELRQQRQETVSAMLAALKNLGLGRFPEEMNHPRLGRFLSQLLNRRTHDGPGRPPALRALNGSWLGQATTQYQPRANLLPAEAINLVIGAGGIPVVAYPYSLIRFSSLSWDQVLDELVKIGIQGVEVYHPTHSPADTARFLRSAQQRGLLITGGSDFHCEVNPELLLGTVAGWSPLSYENVAELKATLQKRREGDPPLRE